MSSNLYLRVYEPHDSREAPKRKPSNLPSRVVVFDTETETDIKQNFRVGRYDLYINWKHVQGEFFYPEDLPTFRKFLESESRKPNSAIVGFNLPFDIARVASRYSAARGSMSGGFSFQMTEESRQRVLTKHLGPHKTLIKWNGKPQPRGVWIDVSMLGAALLRPCSLAEMAKRLDTEHRKLETEHGGDIDEHYLEYLRHDVMVTWECYEKLAYLWESYGLQFTPIHRIYSEASIGKAALKQIGIKPFHSLNPDFPPKILGAAMESFYGGRSEVHIRKEPRRIVHVDFLSMYPTVCALMELWKFTTAKEVRYVQSESATREIEKLLSTVQLSDVLQAKFWRQLHTIVQILPNDDLLPARSNYSTNGSPSIGLNFLRTTVPIWYTLADCIVSKLLTGKVPKILDAITVTPYGKQTGLQTWNVMGKPEYEVEPYHTDFYKRLIELRATTSGYVREALKYVANSTCYGIYAELNAIPNDEARHPYLTGNGEQILSCRRPAEEPGTYHNPLLATFITGAARLMLATLERQVKDANLDWCFCDTDSLCIAIDSDSDIPRVQEIVQSYESVSPYPTLKHVLKVEHGIDTETYAYCVSAKRYALFTKQDSKVSIVKASAHGLGHLRAPYGDIHTKEGAAEWILSVWQELLSQNLTKSHKPSESLKLSVPAMSQFTVTSPILLRYGMQPYSFASLFRTNHSSHMSAQTVVAPFATTPIDAAKYGCSTVNGQPVPVRFLQTYSDAIREYFNHAESKFKNGNKNGILERRHVEIAPDAIVYIGKEGADIEERSVGLKDGSKPYGTTGKKKMPEVTYSRLEKATVEQLEQAIEIYGIVEVARRIGIDKHSCRRAIENEGRTRKKKQIEEGLKGMIC